MILIDANLLLYAYNKSSEHQVRAREWLEDMFSKPQPVRLAWVTIVTFLRIGTSSRAYPHPLTNKQANDIVSSWLIQPSVDILSPGEGHWEILSGLLNKSQALGSLVTDAHLAALAIEHGAILCTSDQDFTRFSGLQWKNPLESHRPSKEI